MKRMLPLYLFGTILVTPAYQVVAADNLSDAQVSKILTTANDGEVLLAQHVIAKSTNARVKQFARHMLDDHSLNNVLNRNIASKESIVPEDSKQSEEILLKGEEASAKLMGLKGHSLDVAYMDDQVKTHTMVLNDLRTSLIPETKDEALRGHLEKTAKKVEMHLNHAKELRATL